MLREDFYDTAQSDKKDSEQAMKKSASFAEQHSEVDPSEAMKMKRRKTRVELDRE